MRARGIKPGFWKNEDLAECSPYARLLYIGLWSMCDWEGRTEYRAKRIKAELFPYNDDIDMKSCFLELQERGFVVFYDNAKFLYVPNFTKHQNPHKNERVTPSTYPKPTKENICFLEDGTKTELGRNKDGTTRAVHCLLIPDSCTPDSGTESASPPTVPEKEKSKTDPNCEAILHAWGKAISIRADWIPQVKMPGNKDTRNLLKLRASEPDFVGMLDRYVELVTALDWAEAKEIVFFLRRQTFDNCMSGEFSPSKKGKSGFIEKQKAKDVAERAAYGISEDDPPWVAARKRNEAYNLTTYGKANPAECDLI